MVRSNSKSRAPTTPAKKAKGKVKRRTTAMHTHASVPTTTTTSTATSPSHSQTSCTAAEPGTPTRQIGSPNRAQLSTGPRGFHSPAPLPKSPDSARRQLFTTEDKIPRSPAVEDKLSAMRLGSAAKKTAQAAKSALRGPASPSGVAAVGAAAVAVPIRRSRRFRKEEDEDRAPVFAPSAFVVNTVSTACTAIGNGFRKITSLGATQAAPAAEANTVVVVDERVMATQAELEGLEATALGSNSGIARFDSDEEDEIIDYSDPYNWIASFRPKFLEVKAQKLLRPILPPRTKSSPKITLVLDLDETLVHSSTLGGEQRPNTTRFHVNFCDQVYTVDAGIRPHAARFIQEVGKIFEVVVFTASMKVYADEICRILDPSSQLITRRLYREHCLFYDPNYLKDLDILGRDPRRVVIVDNLIQAFALHLDNGIPIPDWRNDNDCDDELLKILDFLKTIKDVDDVRPHIRKRWKISQLVDAANARLSGLTTTLTAKAA